MKKWQAEINLSRFWKKDENGNDWNHKTANVIGVLVAKELKKILPKFSDDDSLEDIISRFESINTVEEWEVLCDEDVVPYWESNPPIEEFNNLMVELYDFADSYDVWVKTNF